MLNTSEVEKILRHYNPDYDLGPDCPVTWREERLASALLDLNEQIEKLQAQVAALLDAVPSAARVTEKQIAPRR